MKLASFFIGEDYTLNGMKKNLIILGYLIKTYILINTHYYNILHKKCIFISTFVITYIILFCYLDMRCSLISIFIHMFNIFFIYWETLGSTWTSGTINECEIALECKYKCNCMRNCKHKTYTQHRQAIILVPHSENKRLFMANTYIIISFLW